MLVRWQIECLLFWQIPEALTDGMTGKVARAQRDGADAGSLAAGSGRKWIG